MEPSRVEQMGKNKPVQQQHARGRPFSRSTPARNFPGSSDAVKTLNIRLENLEIVDDGGASVDVPSEGMEAPDDGWGVGGAAEVIKTVLNSPNAVRSVPQTNGPMILALKQGLVARTDR